MKHRSCEETPKL